MARWRNSDDPETCWAVFLLAKCVAQQRRRLAALSAPGEDGTPPQ